MTHPKYWFHHPLLQFCHQLHFWFEDQYNNFLSDTTKVLDIWPNICLRKTTRQMLCAWGLDGFQLDKKNKHFSNARTTHKLLFVLDWAPKQVCCQGVENIGRKKNRQIPDGNYDSLWCYSVGRVKRGTSLGQATWDWWQPLRSMSVPDTLKAKIWVSWTYLHPFHPPRCHLFLNLFLSTVTWLRRHSS